MKDAKETAAKFLELLDVMRKLRAPGGCPWDREQDYLSLRRYIIEEAYELIEAIESGKTRNVCEESGDLLLQVVFVSCIAEEEGEFDIADVMSALVTKLVRRHPHVFGDVHVDGSDDVLKNWEQIKVQERKEKHEDASLLAGVPRGLPSLLRAYRMQERAAKVGFDWPKGDPAPVFAKVGEEIAELKEALADPAATKEKIDEEMGDLLFAVVNMARHLDVDPESALQAANAKFADRFRAVEKLAEARGLIMEETSLDDLDKLWVEAKEAIKGKKG